jgi:predicted nucleotidyltransferase
MIPALAVVPEEVEAVLLFGSQVRGDSDSSSDVDIAAFVNVNSADALIEVKKRLCVSAPECNLSVYSLPTANLMANDGSLFLWHLKFEGKYLFSRGRSFHVIMDSLKPYSCDKALRDVGTFEEVLKDVRASLTSGPELTLYEAATLFSILRSLGMIASVVDGCPNFRRVEPIEYLSRLMGGELAISDSDIECLVRARHLYARNVGDDVEIDRTFALRIAAAVGQAAEFVRSHVSTKLQ